MPTLCGAFSNRKKQEIPILDKNICILLLLILFLLLLLLLEQNFKRILQLEVGPIDIASQSYRHFLNLCIKKNVCFDSLSFRNLTFIS